MEEGGTTRDMKKQFKDVLRTCRQERKAEIVAAVAESLAYLAWKHLFG